MSADGFGIVTLSLYALLAVAGIVWHCRSSQLPWQTWVLTLIQRIYVPLMFGWRANRRCTFPDGAAIILANHRSPADPLMLWQNVHLTDSGRRPFRPIRFLMAKEYLDVPVVGWMTRHIHVIPVERQGRDLGPTRRALRSLQNGEWVGIFPEGGINQGTDLMEGDTGVAWLALRSQAPVCPVFIHNSPRGKSMVDPFWTPSRVRVTYGEPIDLSAYHGRRKSQEVLREVTDLMMQRLADLGGVTYRGRKTVPFDPPRTATG